MYRNVSLKVKLTIVMLVLGLVPLLVTGFFQLSESKSALNAQVFSHLESLREVKRGRIEGQFATITAQAQVLSENRMIVKAMKQLKIAFSDMPGELAMADEEMTGDLDISGLRRV